jgi:hypothetical protein
MAVYSLLLLLLLNVYSEKGKTTTDDCTESIQTVFSGIVIIFAKYLLCVIYNVIVIVKTIKEYL